MKFFAGLVALWLLLNTSAACQTFDSEPRVFVTDSDAATNPAVTAIARAISEACPQVLIASTMADADYIVSWHKREARFSQWGGDENILDIYRRNGRWFGRTGGYRYVDAAKGVCRAIRRAETPSPQPVSPGTQR